MNPAHFWGSQLHMPLLPSYILSLTSSWWALSLLIRGTYETSNATMTSRLSDAFDRLTAAGEQRSRAWSEMSSSPAWLDTRLNVDMWRLKGTGQAHRPWASNGL